MTGRATTMGLLAIVVCAVTAGAALAQKGEERFSATATVTGAGGGKATAPVTIVVSRRMSKDEADTLIHAFRTGGAAGLRKALTGVPRTGSLQVGGGRAVPLRLALERVTDQGRLITLVADEPVLFIGAGMPDAKPKEGYDFAIVDLVVDAKGSGTGVLAPAAKVRLNGEAFVVDDYGVEKVQLADVKRK